MIKEHDCVVLMQDLTGASLKAGDVGTGRVELRKAFASSIFAMTKRQ
jgi:hypothetical protein